MTPRCALTGVAASEPGEKLRLRAEVRAPGQAWLEITTAPGRYTQRAIFYPRGIPGRLYWFLFRPLHMAELRKLARDVVAGQ